MEESSEVKEGFICPICMKDLCSQLELQSHFEEAHSSREDPAKFQNNKAKGMFDKAKRKILGKADDANELAAWGRREEVQVTAMEKELEFSYWEPQDVGK